MPPPEAATLTPAPRPVRPPRLAALVAELEGHGAELALGQAAQLLSRATLTLDDVRSFVEHSERGYVRRRVVRTEAFELLVMTWGRGQSSGPHDHGGSHCSFRVVRGNIVEARFTRRADGLVEIEQSRLHREGDVVTAQGMGIHALTAERELDDPVVTLHVYVPPLPELRRYPTRREPGAPLSTFTRRCDATGKTVAVIGGGFSGTMVAAHLLRTASDRSECLHVVVLERQSSIGEGAAYRTAEPLHLLNVPAARMSAWPDRPDHFLAWARRERPDTDGYAFLPRLRYGEYLRSTLFEAAGCAAPSTSLELRQGEASRVARISHGFRIELADGSALAVDGVVIAAGHRPPRDPFGARWQGPRARYIGDPWASLAITAIGPDEPVLIVGSGLTAIDVILSLTRTERRAPIHVISRHGLWPDGHADEMLTPADMGGWVDEILRTPGGVTCLGLVSALRRELHAARASGIDPRAVIDGLRPHTERLWSALGAREAARFVRHVRPHWEVRRHRMAPAVARHIAELGEAGALSLVAGGVERADADGEGVNVRVRRRGAAHSETVRASWVVNCTGPGSGVGDDRGAIVGALLDAGELSVEPLGLGVATTPRGEAIARDGRVLSDLIVVGPLRKGQLWEATAVPELRVQARDAAHALLARLEREPV